MKFKIFITICLLFLVPALAKAEKTDVLFLKNGDRITGEIRKLEAGLLEFKTDTMGTVNIEWRFISEVISDTNQYVGITDGARVLGTLQKPEVGEHVIVITEHGPVDVQSDDIISVWPVAATFIDRMDLDMGFGLDYQKATDIADLNAAIDFRLRGPDRLTEASLRVDITQQSGAEDQTRWDLDSFHEYLLANRRFRNWFGKIESNEALGVNLRLSGGAAFGKYLIKTNDTWFALSGGLLATQENPEGGDSVINLEAVGNIRYRYFRFADPERSLDTTFSVFPNLTDSGRWRGNFRTTFKLELIKDLFWSMEVYATYDNQPLSIGAEKIDYGIVNSVGWSF